MLLAGRWLHDLQMTYTLMNSVLQSQRFDRKTFNVRLGFSKHSSRERNSRESGHVITVVIIKVLIIADSSMLGLDFSDTFCILYIFFEASVNYFI